MVIDDYFNNDIPPRSVNRVHSRIPEHNKRSQKKAHHHYHYNPQHYRGHTKSGKVPASFKQFKSGQYSRPKAQTIVHIMDTDEGGLSMRRNRDYITKQKRGHKKGKSANINKPKKKNKHIDLVHVSSDDDTVKIKIKNGIVCSLLS